MPSSAPKKQAGGRRKQKNKQPTSLNDVLEAAERLDSESQVELVSILSHRIAERGRERLVASVAQARREFAAGLCRVLSPAEIIREALS